MNAKPHPLLWLLSGFLSCAVLLTGILWWRGGGNPFLKTAPVGDPPLLAAPARPTTPPPVADPAPADPPPPAAAGAVDPAPSPVAAISPTPAPPEDEAAPAAADPPVPSSVKDALASATPSSLSVLASLAKGGTLPPTPLTEAAYQWGMRHLPADPTNQDAPFEDVVKLLKDAPTPEERGFAALALAGSGRSLEALEAIRKAHDSLTPESPERFLVEEALKLATTMPDEAAPGEDGNLKATAPKPTSPPSPPAPTAAAPAPAKPASEAGPGESVRRPVLPHETPEDSARTARRLKEATEDPEPAAPSLTSPAPPLVVVPMQTGGGARQTKIQPAN